MTPNISFVEFPKIYRYSREVIVTEKIDGTNAQIYIPDGTECDCGHQMSMHGDHADGFDGVCRQWVDGDPCMKKCRCNRFHVTPKIFAGSRTKWITPQQDNHGFAKWVQENKEELLKLGPGSHFGEWWGPGIQRGYGLKQKRFSLFNVHRWGDSGKRPACCGVVPELWRGDMDDLDCDEIIGRLRIEGSVAAPGFMRPEGIVIFHVPSGVLFKKTLEKDESPKSLVEVK